MVENRSLGPGTGPRSRFCHACGLVSSLWLPVLALVLASAVALGLLGFKIVWSGRWRQLYLAWNLFLAWVPLLCAWMAWRDIEQVRPRNFKSITAIVLWFLFFPNAPYMMTDLIHLAGSRGGHYWADLILIFFFALTGLVAGFISLYLMHTVVRRFLGWAAGWGFVGCMAGLTGLGVYLGRFLRWNSWDLLLNPLSLGWDVTQHFASPANHPLALVFPVLFGAFLFVTYAMLYGLTFLPRETLGLAPVLPLLEREPHSNRHLRASSP